MGANPVGAENLVAEPVKRDRRAVDIDAGYTFVGQAGKDCNFLPSHFHVLAQAAPALSSVAGAIYPVYLFYIDCNLARGGFRQLQQPPPGNYEWPCRRYAHWLCAAPCAPIVSKYTLV